MSVKLGNTNIAGAQVLYSTTGNNTDGAMTQKATTTQLNLKANDADVVHKTGNENITGTKTFTGDGWITKIQNTDVTYNTAPSSNKSTGIAFVDKKGTQMGIVECYRWTDNSTVMQLNTYGPNGKFGSALQFRMFSDGYSIAYAPTPGVDAYRNEIATTAYINTKFQVVSTLPANPDSNVFYLIPE